MFDMINIFEVFLPQLLRYPNPTDPLNGEAAALLMREPKSYEARVKGKQGQPDPLVSQVVSQLLLGTNWDRICGEICFEQC